MHLGLFAHSTTWPWLASFLTMTAIVVKCCQNYTITIAVALWMHVVQCGQDEGGMFGRRHKGLGGGRGMFGGARVLGGGGCTLQAYYCC